MENKKLFLIADSYFKSYPTENVIYVCDDGNVFLNNNRADGVAHATAKAIEITTVKRSDLANLSKEEKETKSEGKSVSILPDDSWSRKQLLEWLASKEITVAKNISNLDLKAKVQEVLSETETEVGNREEVEKALQEKGIQYDATLTVGQLLELLNAGTLTL